MPDVDDTHTTEKDAENPGRWSVLTLVGAMGLYCLGPLALVGGAAVTGGAAAGITATTAGVGGLGGIVVLGLATVLPLLGVGLFLKRRATQS